MESAIAIAAILGILSTIISLVQELIYKRKNRKKPSLQDRLTDLTQRLESSAAVITEIEDEISVRKNLALQLEDDIERYNVLKEVSQPQIEAIAQVLNIPLKRESRKSFIYNFITNLLIAGAFFALGYFAGGR